mmetsp:Transcript_132917/g.187812  ORF Transcript_132917/g.187812 Transcript_132917/m.187812 type:complete len:361 (+) Transcript_132917:533-1615(+)
MLAGLENRAVGNRLILDKTSFVLDLKFLSGFLLGSRGEGWRLHFVSSREFDLGLINKGLMPSRGPCKRVWNIHATQRSTRTEDFAPFLVGLVSHLVMHFLCTHLEVDEASLHAVTSVLDLSFDLGLAVVDVGLDMFRWTGKNANLLSNLVALCLELCTFLLGKVLALKTKVDLSKLGGQVHVAVDELLHILGLFPRGCGLLAFQGCKGRFEGISLFLKGGDLLVEVNFDFVAPHGLRSVHWAHHGWSHHGWSSVDWGSLRKTNTVDMESKGAGGNAKSFLDLLVRREDDDIAIGICVRNHELFRVGEAKELEELRTDEFDVMCRDETTTTCLSVQTDLESDFLGRWGGLLGCSFSKHGFF